MADEQRRMRYMAVAANYKKSFRLLIDRDMKNKEFAEKTVSASPPSPRWAKAVPLISSEVLVKICAVLGRTMDEIAEVVHND